MPVLTTLGAATAKAWGFLQQVAAAADPYFNYVTMLLTGNGTNGAQNNTFLDSSSNAFSITRNGNTTQGSFSPYGSLWSNYFDGSSDTGEYVPAGSAFAYGTGDFTVECWFYMTSLPSYGTHLLAQTVSGTNYFLCRAGTGYVSSERKLEFRWGSTAITGSTIFSLNTWNHAAFVRRSGVVYLYLNGTLDGSGSVTDDFNNTTYNPTIGRSTHSAENLMTGYISNMRVVKGTGVYTSNFTPSTTPLTAISGTSLLTCQSNRFVDNSGNNFTVTPIGSTSVQRFSPFNPTASYDTATIGGSGYFDGTGDYLSVASSTDFDLASTSFTMEFWAYFNTSGYSTTTEYWALGRSNGSGQGFGFYKFGTNGNANCWDFYFGNYSLSQTTQTKPGQWYHLAVSRDNSTGRASFYINGTRVATSTSATGVNYTSQPLYISSFSGSSSYFPGYISDVRIVKGSYVYDPASTTLTVPTAPLTAVTNTKLLTNMTNAGIPDSAMMNDLETVGNAQVSTSVKKFGTGSISLDGTGDKLIAPYQPWMNFGTGDFTVEMWINFNTALASLNDNSGIYVYRSASLENTSCNIRTRQTPGIAVQLGATDTNFSWNPSTGTWYHLAIVRSSGTLTMYVNGTSVGSGTNTGNVTYESGYFLTIGGNPAVSTLNINAYIDDLRITKGYARYTSNFTAPTAAFPTY